MIDRRQIKKEYKEKTLPAAIYTVVNKIDNKVFIGKTRSPNSVIYRLNSELERDTHPFKDMISDYNENGKDNFEITLYNELDVSKLEEEEIIEKLELLYEKCRAELAEKGYSFYNIRPGH